ncbi:LolA-like outer membrane lipoprotein chaperone [bacterium]|nr:LolA-like outer membrane lipoprotein chaperone [bacterium]MBU1994292.1 LolA-like outer membrane lipoprotein chaperone [bacterium]
MKYLFFLLILASEIFAFFDAISSFQADFTQTVTDEKNKTISYSGTIIAEKPQNAMWTYEKPVKKNIYISSNSVTIVEPEIEQVIIKKIESNFDFFKMIQGAKQIENDTYIAIYEKSKFTITTKNKLIESISYKDEFENKVKIIFKNQKQNIEIDSQQFIPKIPIEFDIIRD